MVRNLMFRHVQLFAFEKEEELADLDNYLDDAPDWPAAMDDYFDEYDDLGIDAKARGGDMISIDRKAGEGLWHVIQILDDPEGDHGWRFEAGVDLAASDEYGEVRLASLRIIQG
ncbi:MAG: DUF3516 domain-containing protein, partial [Corynebacterium sp.]|nr:DUF3516 domain-containing protein [Corynebacterium sp.]